MSEGIRFFGSDDFYFLILSIIIAEVHFNIILMYILYLGETFVAVGMMLLDLSFGL